MFAIVAWALLCACGGGNPPPSSPAVAAPVPVAAAPAEVGPDGPADLVVPAITISTDPALVASGEKVFTDKGCVACHKFGEKLVGPDLNGVTQRRTAAWIEKQVRYPEKMTKEDPVSKALLASLMVQMTDQGVSDDELPALLAFLHSKSP